jgi:thiamine pyrophosphokinase
MKRAVILANGKARDYSILSSLIRKGDTIIAADGGANHLKKMEMVPDVLIGDLDSVSKGEVKRLETLGTRVIRFPVEKDETDLELSLGYALDQGFREILILAPFGGRLDQTLGNISLLSRPELEGIDTRMDDGLEEVFIIRGQAIVKGSPGETISLLAIGVEAKGVETDGLYYPLKGETLFTHATRGISNRLVKNSATIRVREGMLLCIHTRQRN